MRKLRNVRPGVHRPKLPKGLEELKSIGNKRLAEHTRKLLAKHYASKYRVR
jgi:hypothetical protein